MAALISGPAAAQINGSVSLVSDYRFRGISLSNGHPALQAHLGYDDDSGWYVGGFASRVDLPAQPDNRLQLSAYGGYAGRLRSGLVWEAGAIRTAYPGAGGYNYVEAFAGLSVNNVSGRIYFSPDYPGDYGRTAYVELNGAMPLQEWLRLVGHLGYLHAIYRNPANPALRDRADLSVGMEARVKNTSLRLSWINSYADSGGTQVNGDPQIYGGPGNPQAPGNQKTHAWVLSASLSF